MKRRFSKEEFQQLLWEANEIVVSDGGVKEVIDLRRRRRYVVTKREADEVEVEEVQA